MGAVGSLHRGVVGVRCVTGLVYDWVRFRPCPSRLTAFSSPTVSVDKKAKKRLEVIRKKLETLQMRLSGVREQADDPSEITDLETEIARLETERAELKKK